MMCRRLACLVAASLLFPAAADAQRPMTIVDLINVPVVARRSCRPTAPRWCYVRADADWTANKRISHLWRVAHRRYRRRPS